jgi:hypothetical protein
VKITRANVKCAETRKRFLTAYKSVDEAAASMEPMEDRMKGRAVDDDGDWLVCEFPVLRRVRQEGDVGHVDVLDARVAQNGGRYVCEIGQRELGERWGMTEVDEVAGDLGKTVLVHFEREGGVYGRQLEVFDSGEGVHRPQQLGKTVADGHEREAGLRRIRRADAELEPAQMAGDAYIRATQAAPEQREKGVERILGVRCVGCVEIEVEVDVREEMVVGAVEEGAGCCCACAECLAVGFVVCYGVDDQVVDLLW